MNTRAHDMERLDRQARELARYKNAPAFLADALTCVRDTRDPISALDLLHAMWTSGHARRGGQRVALRAVGRWLDARLERDPELSPDTLAHELGWLRRLVVFHKPARFDEAPRYHRKDPPGFGEGRVQLRDRRKRVAEVEREVAMREAVKREAARAAAEAAARRPSHVPARFAAHFADLGQARKLWKKYKSRPARDRWLPITAVDRELAHLMDGVGCSALRTEGLGELFARMAAASGQAVDFEVRAEDIEAPDDKGRRVVGRIWLGDDG